MNLVIDIGNTKVKLALFNNNSIEYQTTLGLQDLENEIDKIEFRKGILCSVLDNIIIDKILEKNSEILKLSEKTSIPIKNNYKTKKTLGLDRLANVIGANSISKNINCLVIDIGTCLKFDFKNKNNEYLGGSISPGLEMRFKALNAFTNKLPLIENIENPELIGVNTNNSIMSGVINGMKSEIIQMINEYRDKYDKISIYLTGGDLEVFKSIAKQQKNSIFALNYLTLQGLNTILEHNAK